MQKAKEDERKETNFKRNRNPILRHETKNKHLLPVKRPRRRVTRMINEPIYCYNHKGKLSILWGYIKRADDNIIRFLKI